MPAPARPTPPAIPGCGATACPSSSPANRPTATPSSPPRRSPSSPTTSSSSSTPDKDGSAQMAETQVFDAAETQAREIALVDCDIHPVPGSLEELAAYLPRASRQQAERHGFFDGRRLGRMWGPHYFWGGGLRTDAYPAEGQSSLDLVREQLLDLYGVDVGILNLPSPFDRAFPDLARDGARAVNDW